MCRAFSPLSQPGTLPGPTPNTRRLHRQLSRDVSFLEAAQVMDYSLLLGVHFCSRGRQDASATAAAAMAAPGDVGGGGSGGNGAAVVRATPSRLREPQLSLASGITYE
jgi:hypothetical protein